MKITGKVCSVEDCNWPLFARGYCKSHYNILYLLPRQREKSKKRYTIPRRTEDRSKEEQIYSKKRTAFIIAQIVLNKQGHIFCIFCGKRIYGDPDLHHGDGRDNDKLLNEKDWFLSHHECHVHEYHSKSWELLSWWDGYIERIKISHPHIYKKELKKMNK